MPAAFRLGISASVIYLLYLVPRLEWHGGWSPPLRYIVVFMPILGLGVAAMWQRVTAGAVVAPTVWTIALGAAGLAYPGRLFHVENGEDVIGEPVWAVWH